MSAQLPFDEGNVERLIVESLDRILALEDSEAFLAWAREAFPPMLGLYPSDLPQEDQHRMANAFATVIWNGTPLPSNGFRPRPLPNPERNASCPCGSGRKYKLCCAQLPPLPELAAEEIWGALLDRLSDEQLERAVTSRALPTHLLSEVGQRWLADDKPRKVLALLEPLFTDHPERLDARFGLALDSLCDAYDRLAYTRKKGDLLDRMIREGSRPLKATAWQRRCTMRIDERDFPAAEAAFSEALRLGPDDLETALLEIVMLGTQHKYETIRERARFWQKKFQRLGFDEGEPIMGILDQATRDPQAALAASFTGDSDPLLTALGTWVAEFKDRPLPVYARRPVAGKSKKAKGKVESPLQSDLFTEEEAPTESLPPSTTEALEARLVTPAPLRRLETEWRRLFPLDKPFSVHLVPFGDEDPWEQAQWVEFLEEHPEAADSLDILDDIATAVTAHPHTGLPWLGRSILLPLLERGQAILDRAVPTGSPEAIPWGLPQNRPGLRLLYRQYLYHEEEGDSQEAQACMERLLQLNPEDNHGARAELMNLYLRAGENDAALALAGRYPDDRLFPELAYGKVLALYRLGERERAAAALAEARLRLPEIPRYLIPKRTKQPQLNPLGLSPGGEDQAWHYRGSMRDVWEAEPGALTWLKKLTA